MLLALLGLLLLSVPFWIWPIDLALQSAVFDPERGGWFVGNREPWQFIYKAGTLPALIFVLVTIGIFVLSFRLREVLPARKLALYFVLCMLIGPGLFINAVFKEHWGRPRPRDVEPFGGQFAHERVWQYDASSPGKSFPCGHCSMGFYFFSLGIVCFAAGRRRAGWSVMGGAVVLGAFLGAARVFQGGHFLSDVLWSAGMCLLVSIGLFYALALDRSMAYVPRRRDDSQLRIPVWVKLTGAGAMLFAIIAIAVATPYQSHESYDLSLTEGQSFELSLILEGDAHEIVLSAEQPPGIEIDGRGFGLPGSAVKSVWKDEEGDTPEERYFQYKQRKSGFFTELNQTSQIVIPPDWSGDAKVVVNSGRLTLDLSQIAAPQKWRVQSTGEVQILEPEGDAAEMLELEIDAD